MENFVRTCIKSAILIVAIAALSMTLSAQENNTEAYDKAKQEITQTFGTFPSFFDVFPQHALPGAWQLFKELKGPKSNIDAKNSELIQLAVAAQIPCDYCVYFHTESAKAYGATDEEIKEAVALGAETRHWSMILQGSQIDLEDFKMEFDQMMKYMAEQASAK